MIIGIDASRALVKERAGTENYSYQLIEALLKLPQSRRHQFRLYLKRRAVVTDWWKERAETVVINWPRLWTQAGLALECLKRPVDVLFIPAHTLPLIRRPNLKTVVTIHGLEYEYLPEYYRFPQKLYLNRSTEYAVRHASKLIAVSQWTKKQLQERLGADRKKISVIYEGVSSKFTQWRAKLTDGDLALRSYTQIPVCRKEWRRIKHKYGLGKRYILFVGTIQPRKNLVRLIEAFSLLLGTLRAGPAARHLRRAPPARCLDVNQLQLIIAGKLGWMYEEILGAPKKFGVEKKVKFIGRVAEPDLAAVYKGAELFVWPSLMEGFGLPVLEAMSMGVPVITSNRGALPEVVGEAALQIEPENVRELAEAMSLVLKNRDLQEGLREKGYGQVAKFSWEKAAKKTLKVLTKWD